MHPHTTNPSHHHPTDPPQFIPCPHPLHQKDLDFSPLRDYIQTMLLRWAYYFNNEAELQRTSKRPYKNKRMQEYLVKGKSVINIAKPKDINLLLQMAEKHFGANTRRRAFNILIEDIYLGSLKKGSRRYFYYLAIRIQKLKLINRTDKTKLLAYYASVVKMCPMGQIIHFRIKKRNIFNI